MSAAETIHATCVASGDHAVLLVGPSGAGKSDLALRLIDRGWSLVSDDYTSLRVVGDQLLASPPPRLSGRIEVRGIGIVTMPFRGDVPVLVTCDLAAPVERLPEPRSWAAAGISRPCVPVAAFEMSAPIKVEQALRLVLGR